MDKFGNLQIHVIGKKGNINLSPDNYDVKEIISILHNIEDLLYPTNKNERPIISYNIEEGSVKHVFRTSIQAIIGFSAILAQINKEKSIDFLDLRTALAIENIQNLAYLKDYNFEIKTSTQEDILLEINRNTTYLRTQDIWVNAEFYFYGSLTNAGGKNKANIHLDTEDNGLITIETNKDFLRNQEENMLYKNFGVRVAGKQNIQTGELDKSSLKLLGLIEFTPKYNENYLKGLISKAKKNFKEVDPDEWINKMRGGYET